MTKAFADAAKELGPISVLIYNAGGGGFGKTVMEIGDGNKITLVFDFVFRFCRICTKLCSVMFGSIALHPSSSSHDAGK